MSLVKWAFIGVILLPLGEFIAFAAVALVIGWLLAMTLFVATSGAGILLLRRAGRRDLDRFRSVLSARGLSAINLDTPGLASIAGAILLVLPGFITDLAGALLLLPPARRWIRAAIGRALRKERAATNSDVVDLAPSEWRQVSETIEAHDQERISPRRRKRAP
jgi:UPF0716 protein FxsA